MLRARVTWLALLLALGGCDGATQVPAAVIKIRRGIRIRRGVIGRLYSRKA